MRFLVDTNIFLEVILEQEKADEAKSFLEKTNEHDLFISDYSLHSIGLLLFRKKKYDAFSNFLSDMISNAGIIMTALSTEDMKAVINSAQRFTLDFDDAYQYAVAETYGMIIVSFDRDYERT